MTIYFFWACPPRREARRSGYARFQCTAAQPLRTAPVGAPLLSLTQNGTPYGIPLLVGAYWASDAEGCERSEAGAAVQARRVEPLHATAVLSE